MINLLQLPLFTAPAGSPVLTPGLGLSHFISLVTIALILGALILMATCLISLPPQLADIFLMCITILFLLLLFHILVIGLLLPPLGTM